MTKDEIAPIIIGKMLNLGGLLNRTGNRLLLPHNLNQHQYSILFSIHQEDRVRQKSIINKLLLEKAHVSKVIKKLHAMGMIEIEASAQDKRSSWLSITEKGKRTVAACQQSIRRWNLAWTENLDGPQLEAILESLAVLQDRMREMDDFE